MFVVYLKGATVLINDTIGQLSSISACWSNPYPLNAPLEDFINQACSICPISFITRCNE